MRLLQPTSFRLTTEQDRWLAEQAVAAGHASKALILRMLITKAMRESARGHA